MYTPINLIPHNNRDERDRLSKRWISASGVSSMKSIIELIKEGAGLNFLSAIPTIENGGVIKDEYDLRAVSLGPLSGKLTFSFARQESETDFLQLIETFYGLDFSYSSFDNLTFENAFFVDCNFNFTEFENTNFIGCIFLYTRFYGSVFKNTKFSNCDFTNGCSIDNCDIEDSVFEHNFYIYQLFYNSKFNTNTKINHINENVINTPLVKFQLDKKYISDIYKGIKECYANGGERDFARTYFELEMKYKTRMNINSMPKKLVSFFLEYTSGYGVKPIRALVSILILFLFFTLIYKFIFGLPNALLLSAGALFTFGSNTEVITNQSILVKIIYIIESFFGVSSVALFVTVLYNYLFRDM
jgi:uncharacterized protein YjbI with pentapeptide repeats